MVVSYRIARPQVASLVAMQIGDALGGRGEDPLAMVAWGIVGQRHGGAGTALRSMA